MTEETKKKLSQALKGRKLTEEHKRNISKANKGLGKGIPKSDSHKFNLKKATKLRWDKKRARDMWSFRASIQLPEYYS